MNLHTANRQLLAFNGREGTFLSEKRILKPYLADVAPPAFQLDRLCVFSFAWATASLIHCLSYGERLTSQHPFAPALLVAAVLVMLVPHSIGLLLLLLGLSLSNTLTWMPIEPNHILFEFIVNVGIVGALGWTIARHYASGRTLRDLRLPVVRTALFNSFAPIARVSLVVLYFFAVLHKLNWDYFNVQTSCSTTLLQGFGHRLPFVHDSLPFRWGAVWGTVLVEAAIPILLCLRRTRWAGILLGMGFHSFLALHPANGLYSFSGLLFACYLLFVPAEFPQRLQRLAQSLLGKSLPLVALALRGLVGLGALGLLASGRSVHALAVAGLLLCLGWALLLLAAHVLALGGRAPAPERCSTMLRVRPAAGWLIPAILVFNGLNPYLGLKTEKTFSMFSNLRTEGGTSNHILIPKPLYLTNLQLDLVDIQATDLAQLQGFITGRQLITYFKLRSVTSAAKTNFYVRFTRNGIPQTVWVKNGVCNQPELLIPYPWLVNKFVRFRAIDKGPCLCKH